MCLRYSAKKHTMKSARKNIVLFEQTTEKVALSDDKFDAKTDGKIINMLWIIMLKPGL